MTRFFLLPLLALSAAACSSDSGEDIPPLPEPTAEGANQLMQDAERASANAAARAEPKAAPARSAPETNTTTTNEVTP